MAKILLVVLVLSLSLPAFAGGRGGRGGHRGGHGGGYYGGYGRNGCDDRRYCGGSENNTWKYVAYGVGGAIIGYLLGRSSAKPAAVPCVTEAPQPVLIPQGMGYCPQPFVDTQTIIRPTTTGSCGGGTGQSSTCATRQCPRCHVAVRSGVTRCPNCSLYFASQARQDWGNDDD